MRFRECLTVCVALLAAGCLEISGPTNHGSSEEPSSMQGMVAGHNAVRTNANPAPQAPLPELVWSSTIADIAQSYAGNCVFAHSGHGGLGENLYAETGVTSTPAQVVNSWASEVTDYDYWSNTCAAGEQCGHYTQIVWDDTGFLGCGRAACTRNSPFGGGASWTLWVCNYDPPGNFNGRRPY